ncbi:MAG: hypothetical protein DI528_14395 [Shinella sp.]|nr:MAG: hypothetical protein DI528_14395 [Shinella sp.]
MLEEMKAARLRIDEDIRTMNQFEVLSIIAIGLIYWFMISEKLDSYFLLIIITAFPVLIAGYGLVRYRAHAAVIRVHDKYIKFHIERAIYGRTSLRGLVRYYDRKKDSSLRNARFAFWGIIFLISFAIFIVAIVAPEKLRG